MSIDRRTRIKSKGNQKILVVSGLVETLTKDLAGHGKIDSVEFAPGSNRLIRIDDFAFQGYPELKSVCIPASVESIGQNCFAAPPGYESALESLSFESGSKLRSIGGRAFQDCRLLHSICLPASVSEIGGTTFEDSHFTTINIEAGNRHFCIRKHLILDFSGICIVSHFGNDEATEIPDEIETIGSYSFASRRHIHSVSFGPSPRLRLIERSAFINSGLDSIDIPSSVEEIEDDVFGFCNRLTRITFTATSGLRRIGALVFAYCWGLKSFRVPSSVEFIGKFCFELCAQLSSLTIEIPSHLQEMRSLGPKSMRWFEIPDSVKILRVQVEPRLDGVTMKFGEDSKVEQIDLVSDRLNFWGFRFGIRGLVRVPTHRLKCLRWRQEFV